MEIIIGFLIGCVVMIIICGILHYLHRDESELDFDADARYLNVCIEKEIKFYMSTEIMQQDLEIIGTDTFNKMLEVISQRIILCLSEKYLKTISRYFSQQGLQSYVFQLVLDYVLPYCVNNNALKEHYDRKEAMK